MSRACGAFFGHVFIIANWFVGIAIGFGNVRIINNLFLGELKIPSFNQFGRD